MIVVTVGTELPFDRMVQVVDRWAGASGRSDVFAQIGNTTWHPRHLRYARFVEPGEFASMLAAASMIISHAGMGTILSALRYEKPILVVPRRAALGEQRSDHQLATAHRLSEMGVIQVALDEDALRRRLGHLDDLTASVRIGPFASKELLAGIRRFIIGNSDLPSSSLAPPVHHGRSTELHGPDPG